MATAAKKTIAPATKATPAKTPAKKLQPKYGLAKIGAMGSNHKGRGPSLDHIPFMEEVMKAGVQPVDDKGNALNGSAEWYQLAVYAGVNGAAAAASSFRTGKRVLPTGTEAHHFQYRALEAEDGEHSVLALCYVGDKGKQKEAEKK